MLGTSNSQKLGGSHQNALTGGGPAYGAQTYLRGEPRDPRQWYGNWAG